MVSYFCIASRACETPSAPGLTVTAEQQLHIDDALAIGDEERALASGLVSHEGQTQVQWSQQ